MKAMIYTGGLESRMQPGSSDEPRALVEINGEPLLGMLIRRLADKGFDDIIVNVHHFAGRIHEFLRNRDFGNVSVKISEETSLVLDSGGGLKKVAGFFDNNRPFLVYNLEVLSDVDLDLLYQRHTSSGALATLVVRERGSTRFMLFDDDMRLCGWQNLETGETSVYRGSPRNMRKLAFSRIQVISPLLLSLINERGAFSLVDIYLRLAKDHTITGYADNESIWMDLARKEGIIEAEKLFRKN